MDFCGICQRSRTSLWAFGILNVIPLKSLVTHIWHPRRELSKKKEKNSVIIVGMRTNQGFMVPCFRKPLGGLQAKSISVTLYERKLSATYKFQKDCEWLILSLLRKLNIHKKSKLYFTSRSNVLYFFSWLVIPF